MSHIFNPPSAAKKYTLILATHHNCHNHKSVLIHFDEVIALSETSKYTELAKRAGTYVLSTAAGAATAVIFLLLSALIMYVFGLPPYFAGFLSLFSLGAGCMLSGYICGRIKTRSGLRHGFRCAVILIALCVLGALICGTLDGSSALAKTFTAVITGCTGGVLGVNRR